MQIITKIHSCIIIFLCLSIFFACKCLTIPIEKVLKHLAEHEKEFIELEKYYYSITDSIINYGINHKISYNRERKEVSIYLLDEYPRYRNISQDSVLQHLGWNKQVVNKLDELLSNVDCEAINIQSRSEAQFIYLFYKRKCSETTSFKIYQQPTEKAILNSKFGSRIEILNGYDMF